MGGPENLEKETGDERAGERIERYQGIDMDKLEGDEEGNAKREREDKERGGEG